MASGIACGRVHTTATTTTKTAESRNIAAILQIIIDKKFADPNGKE